MGNGACGNATRETVGSFHPICLVLRYLGSYPVSFVDWGCFLETTYYG